MTITFTLDRETIAAIEARAQRTGMTYQQTVQAIVKHTLFFHTERFDHLLTLSKTMTYSEWYTAMQREHKRREEIEKRLREKPHTPRRRRPIDLNV